MSREKIERLLAERQATLKRLGVASIAFFGSVARSEARKDSDVDVLVRFRGRATFDRFMDLKFYLEDLLGGEVDLVTLSALKPRLRSRVLKEAIHVAGL